jgi:hypothetical protein
MHIFARKADMYLIDFTAMKQMKLVLDRRFFDYYIPAIPKYIPYFRRIYRSIVHQVGVVHTCLSWLNGACLF